MATERRLFGTDGVRGEVGTFLTAELATALGRAAAASLDAERPQVLIVRDTRESGPMLEAALAAGIAAAGGDALLGGVLPTPAAAILVKRLGLDLAAVVSASHNPYRGQRDQVLLRRRDQARRRGRGPDRGAGRRRRRRAPTPGRVRELNGGLEDYLRALRGGLPARPLRPQGRPRLRQRRHLPRRPGDLRAARRRGRGDRRRARRAQHQRRLRLDPPRAASPRTSPPATPRSASPSTATATGCWRSTAAAAPTTATS